RGHRRRFGRRGRSAVMNLHRQFVLRVAEQAADPAAANLFGRDDLRVRSVLVPDLGEEFFQVTTLKQQPGRHRSPPQSSQFAAYIRRSLSTTKPANAVQP